KVRLADLRGSECRHSAFFAHAEALQTGAIDVILRLVGCPIHHRSTSIDRRDLKAGSRFSEPSTTVRTNGRVHCNGSSTSVLRDALPVLYREMKAARTRVADQVTFHLARREHDHIRLRTFVDTETWAEPVARHHRVGLGLGYTGCAGRRAAE